MRSFLLLATAAIALATGPGAGASTWGTVDETKFSRGDAAAFDYFGYSVAISGTTAIGGSWWDDDNAFDSGSAYLFDTTTGNETLKLTASDAAANDWFGWSVGIDGTTAIVGSRLDDEAGTDSGSAYLFDTTTGNETFKLTASDGAGSDQFGYSVGIDGTTAIVGAFADDDAGNNSGSAYLFDTINGTQIAKLTANDAGANDWFGDSVAISGTTAIVGSPLDDDNGTNSGSAYLFDVTTGDQLAKLTASDAAANDNFGNSVAISGNIAIVGSQLDDDNGGDSGSAYLFDVSAPTTPTQIAKLTASDGAESDNFGNSVAIDGTTVVVSSPSDDDGGFNSGSAYIYEPAVIPLPAGVWLLGSALAMLVLGRRFRMTGT
jgi:hypothetical protein